MQAATDDECQQRAGIGELGDLVETEEPGDGGHEDTGDAVMSTGVPVRVATRR